MALKSPGVESPGSARPRSRVIAAAGGGATKGATQRSHLHSPRLPTRARVAHARRPAWRRLVDCNRRDEPRTRVMLTLTRPTASETLSCRKATCIRQRCPVPPAVHRITKRRCPPRPGVHAQGNSHLACPRYDILRHVLLFARVAGVSACAAGSGGLQPVNAGQRVRPACRAARHIALKWDMFCFRDHQYLCRGPHGGVREPHPTPPRSGPMRKQRSRAPLCHDHAAPLMSALY